MTIEIETTKRNRKDEEIRVLREDRRVVRNALSKFETSDALRLKEGFAYIKLPKAMSQESQKAVASFFKVILDSRMAP